MFNTSRKLLKSKICLFINVVFATWAAVFRFPNQKHFRALQTHTTQLSHRKWRFVDTLYGTVKKCLTKEICAYLVMQYAGYVIFSVYSSEKVPSKSDRTKRFPYQCLNLWTQISQKQVQNARFQSQKTSVLALFSLKTGSINSGTSEYLLQNLGYWSRAVPFFSFFFLWCGNHSEIVVCLYLFYFVVWIIEILHRTVPFSFIYCGKPCHSCLTKFFYLCSLCRGNPTKRM